MHLNLKKKGLQGYWDCNTMVLQFEDIVDTLKSLVGNTYKYFFILIIAVAMIKPVLMAYVQAILTKGLEVSNAKQETQ